VKYLCFGYYDKGKFDGMTESERNAMFDTCFEYDDHLHASGHWAGGEALQGPETALTLYWKNGKVATTDGPYVPHLMFFQTDKPDACLGRKRGECSGCVCELLVLVCGGVSTAQELFSNGCLLGDGAQMVRWDPRPTHVAPTE
jgi:hypothetical protein